MFTRRAFIAVAALALATGCSKTGTVDFTISKSFTNVNAPGGAFNGPTGHVDLSAEAPEAWGHRDKIKSLDVVAVDALVTAISTTATVSGTVSIVRGTSRAVVGTWPDETISAAPHNVAIVLNPAATALVNDAIRSDGTFDVEFAGTTNKAVTFSADVSMHMKMHYEIKVP